MIKAVICDMYETLITHYHTPLYFCAQMVAGEIGINIFYCYLLLINLITFFAFAVDKIKARLGLWRIRESTLLLLAFIGGAAGGLLAMHVCRHKVRTPRFAYGVPLMLGAQVLVFLLVVGVF